MTTSHLVSETRPGQENSVPDGALLDVRHLGVRLGTPTGSLWPVRDISLTLHERQTIAILGESGSGKSVTSLALMGLLDRNKFAVTSEGMMLRDKDLKSASEQEWQEIRGSRIAMVFQDPQSSLNPVYTIGAQIAETFRLHRGMSKRDARKASIELMDRVRIPDAANKFDAYPHQFSGGMRQRVVIAIALALDPEVLIADEPTTALDVTVQSEILELFRDLARESHMGTVLITHDVAVAATVADEISVMYAGRLVESGPTRQLLEHPSHPYTQGLLRAVPNAADAREELVPITGSPPNLASVPAGCSFHPRCPYAQERCSSERPELRLIEGKRLSACFFAEDVMAHG